MRFLIYFFEKEDKLVDFLYGRTIEKGDLVRVYVNLHQQGRFSVVNVKTGLVCGYATSLLLQDAVFHVSESGRLQVIETRCKKVHAWVKGVFLEDDIRRPSELTEEVKYNPYLHKGFTDTNGTIVTYANQAFLSDKQVYI
jgi:hypothetical protein